MGWKFYSADGSLLTKVPSAATATEATNVTVSANNSTDETVYPTFVDGATGTQGVETDTGLTYNPSSGVLTSTQFTGAVSGNATSATTASTATEVTVSANNSTDETVYPTFVDGATGGQGVETDTGLTYNPSSGVLTTTQVTGALSGNATTASTATEVTVSANNSTDETVYPIFVDGATGAQGIESDTGLTYNPSTGALTATSFTGSVTGAVTGTASEITVSANNSTDETVYPVFVDGATGSQGIESDTGLTYNPSTGLLTSAALTLTGNLTVGGTTTTVNTATFTVEDPIIHLQTASGGGDLGADTNKDVGIAMEYHNGSAAKEAFLGWDDSASKLTFIPDASISSEVVSGSVGTIVANLEGNVTGNVTGTADTATEVTVSANNSTDETIYPVFVDGATGAQGLESDTGLTYNPSTGVLTAGGFTIGSAAILEAELEILDGATVTTTELNLIDGGTARDTNAVATGDGILINDAGTMHMTNVDTVSTYFAAHSVGGGNIVTTGALNAGSITSGFGTIDTGSSTLGCGNITSTGSVTGTSLDCNGNADISGSLTMSGGTLDMSSEDIDNIRSATFIAELDHTTAMNNLESYEIDWGLAQKQMVTLSPNSGNAVTLPFVDPDGPCNLMLKVKQDGTGSRTVTWDTDPAVHWAGGTAPTLTTGANSVDLIAFYFDGVIFYGQASLAFAAP